MDHEVRGEVDFVIEARTWTVNGVNSRSGLSIYSVVKTVTGEGTEKSKGPAKGPVCSRKKSRRPVKKVPVGSEEACAGSG